MRPDPKKRVETAGHQAPLNACAFAGLDLPAGLPPGPAQPPPAAGAPEPGWAMGRVVLRREKAHRGGKTVVVIDGFATHLPPAVIETVARKVRVACGTGGTVVGRRVEIQGDQPAKVRAALEAQGFAVGGIT